VREYAGESVPMRSPSKFPPNYWKARFREELCFVGERDCLAALSQETFYTNAGEKGGV